MSFANGFLMKKRWEEVKELGEKGCGFGGKPFLGIGERFKVLQLGV